MSTYIKDNASKVGFIALVALAIAGCSGEDLTGSDEAELEGFRAEDHAADSEALALSVEPSTSDVYIDGVSTGGSGCPHPGDVTTTLSLDRRTFTIIFDKMILEYPPGPKVKNLNCIASLNLRIPQGLQVSVATVNTRGYVYLPPGGKARQTTSYSFAGNPLDLRPRTDMVGPQDRQFINTDEVAISSLIWSECNAQATFNINTSINLNMTGAPSGTAYFNTEQVDGKFKKVFHLMWRPC